MKNTIRIVLIVLTMTLPFQGKASGEPPSAEELTEHLNPYGYLGQRYRDSNGQEFTLINLNGKTLELVNYRRGVSEDLKPPFYITKEKPRLFQGYPTEMEWHSIQYYKNRNIDTFCFYTVEGDNTPKGRGDRYIFGLIPDTEVDLNPLKDLRNLRF
jgi:hypothetical protein